MSDFDWERYDLHRRHRRKLEFIGGGMRIDLAEVENICSGVALEFCMRPDFDPKWFVKHCRNAMLAYLKQERARFVHYQGTLGSDGEEADEGAILASLGATTRPRQEEYCYASQVITELKKLPSVHQSIMFRIARGDTPIEIAIEDGRPVAHVMGDLRVSRDWVNSWVKEGAA